MLVPLFRTLILYVFIVVAFRIMGKRQVAEMQASEFVITILISAVASVPMQDLSIPLLHGIVPIITLFAAEIFISVVTLKSSRFRKIIGGKPMVIISNGKIDQRALKKMRITLDDVFESLRLKDIFDLRKVQFAQVETNGQVSTILSPEAENVTPEAMGFTPKPRAEMEIIVSDGVLIPKNLSSTCHSAEWLQKILTQNNASSLRDVFLLCANSADDIIFYKKEK